MLATSCHGCFTACCVLSVYVKGSADLRAITVFKSFTAGHVIQRCVSQQAPRAGKLLPLLISRDFQLQACCL